MLMRRSAKYSNSCSADITWTDHHQITPIMQKQNGCWFEDQCYLAALRQAELAAEAEHVDDADEGTGPVTVLGHHTAHAPAVAGQQFNIHVCGWEGKPIN